MSDTQESDPIVEKIAPFVPRRLADDFLPSNSPSEGTRVLPPGAPRAVVPWPSKPEECQCAGEHVCAQVCFALANGSVISDVDLYHIHPMFDPTTNACRGALAHAHELDNLRKDQPNNFNISTYNQITKFLDTPRPDSLSGLSAAQWDSATGVWQETSRPGQVNFSIAPRGGCPSTDASLGCACGGNLGEIPLCLKDCSVERVCNRFSSDSCKNQTVRGECTTASGQKGMCIEEASVVHDCSCQPIPNSVSVESQASL